MHTFYQLSEFPAVPEWIVDPVSPPMLIEKWGSQRVGAWAHEPTHLCVFSKLFDDLAKHLEIAMGAEKMYRKIDKAVT
jgi:hypothetical protein